MADNITIDTITGSPVYATDEISGIHYSKVKVHYGGEGVATDVSSTTSLPVWSYYQELALGNISTQSGVDKFGQNPDIDGAEEDIWDGGGTWVPPTTARTHDLASTSVDDAAAGTGARTVEVFGLSALYALQSETVTLNGTSSVATADTYTMIYRMVVRSAGSGDTAAGAITATAQTDSTVTAQITVGNNQTLMAIFQVPANKTGILWGWRGSNAESSTANSRFRLLAKPDGEVYQVKDVESVNSGSFSRDFKYAPKILAAKTIVKVAADSDAPNAEINAGFQMVLVNS